MKFLMLCVVLALTACGDRYISGPYVTPNMVKETEVKCAANGGWSHIWNSDHDSQGSRWHIKCNNEAKFFSVRIDK